MKKFPVIALGLLLTVSSQAATLVSWENDALEGKEASVTAGRVSEDLKAAPVLKRGSGLLGATYLNSFGARNADETSLDDAIAADCYMTWTMDAKDGLQMNLSDIQVRLSAQDAGPYSVKFVLFSDKTGFVLGKELATYAVGGSGAAADAIGESFTTELSSVAALQGVRSVEFRLYIWGQPGAYTQVGIGQSYKKDSAPDLKISGTVTPVPVAAPVAAPVAKPAM